MSLLTRLADYLGISLDQLLRGEERDTGGTLSELPDDGTLRIVQCVGRKILSMDEWKKLGTKDKIPVKLDAVSVSEKNKAQQISLEIWGAAKIDGDVGGNVNAGDDVACGNVNGDVSADDGVACANVGRDVRAGDSVACVNVGRDVSAGDSVSCCNVGESVNAGKDVTCGDVGGNVSASGSVTINK